MDNAFDVEMTNQEKTELDRLIEQYQEAMRRYHEQKAKDWEEIDRLREETGALLDHLRKVA